MFFLGGKRKKRKPKASGRNPGFCRTVARRGLRWSGSLTRSRLRGAPRDLKRRGVFMQLLNILRRENGIPTRKGQQQSRRAPV